MLQRFIAPSTATLLAASLASMIVITSPASGQVHVDLNATEERKDAVSKLAQNWTIAGESPRQRFDNATVVLRGVGGEMKPVMWKGGIEEAPIASDGVVLDSDDPAAHLEFALSGLTPGELEKLHEGLSMRGLLT